MNHSLTLSQYVATPSPFHKDYRQIFSFLLL
jgi:hypothetical protein